MAVDLGIDLGCAYSRIYSAESGMIIAEEPTVVAFKSNGEPVAFGEEALSMRGKTGSGINVVFPVREGGVTNFDAAVSLVKNMLLKNTASVFSKTRAAVCVPMNAGDVERRALEEVIISAGISEVNLIEASLAAAVGAGIDINEPKGYIMAGIGAGLTTAAVVSLGGTVTAKSVKTAGEAIDNSIIQAIKKRYNVEIAESAAEKLKLRLASALPEAAVDIVAVKGRDMYSGVFKTVQISSREVYDAICEDVFKILDTIRSVLEETPPELASDLIDTGIILTGGGAYLRGLGRLIRDNTGLNVYMAEDPLCAAVKGAGMAMADKGALRGLLFRAGTRKNF